MLKKILSFLFLCCFVSFANADDTNNLRTAEDIMATIHNERPTNCASEIFSDALTEHANEISQMDEEYKVRAWAQNTMQNPEVLEKILQCPEIQTVADETTVVFTPVVYTFENGRSITVNYSTQPKVLKQKILLAHKRSLPNGDVNPQLMNPDDPGKYLNTEPAWYAIMVVQHDSLKDFVGPDKNNTLSLKYINDHIDEIYPHGYYCTSKSAIANDHDTINQVVRQVVDVEDDSNDYYVAGDVNLEWVMYAEIAADVIITIATAGVGEKIMLSARSARAGRSAMHLARNMGRLKKFDSVKDFSRLSYDVASKTDDIARLEKNIKNAKEYQRILRNKTRAKKQSTIAKHEKELADLLEEARKIDPNITEEELHYISKNIQNYQRELTKSEKQLAELLKRGETELPKIEQALKQARQSADPQLLKQYDRSVKELHRLYDAKRTPENARRIKELEETLLKYENIDGIKEYAKLYQQAEDIGAVQKYIEAEENFKTLVNYRRDLQGVHAIKGTQATKEALASREGLSALYHNVRAQTGNIIARTLKAIVKGEKESKAVANATKVARAGMSSRSAKMGDWLMDATLKHGARLAKYERNVGLLYAPVMILADMYDKTSSTSKEFSNGIEFKPLCLLSADDLNGQENVVNYGMWLMWNGDSIDPVDDDAAYLQAMDFAAKFFYQLDEFQNANGANCNVDIYVVRPIIRLDESNLEEPNGEMFYLFMNEIPWSTNSQFSEQIKDIPGWEMAQSGLKNQDPENKRRAEIEYIPIEEEDTDTEETNPENTAE